MDNKKIDPKSRDYNFSDIEPDERFVQLTKEFWFTMISFGIFIVLMIANLYIVSKSSAMVLGFPLWIFFLICLLIGMVIVVLLVCDHVYKDMDITPKGSIKSKDKKNS